jgi:hypothetical protein
MERCARAMSIFGLSILVFVAYILSAGHTTYVVFLVPSGSPIPANVTGWAELDFQRCWGNSKEMMMSSLESDGLNATLEALLSAPLTHAVSCNLRSR